MGSTSPGTQGSESTEYTGVCLEGLSDPDEATRKYYFRVMPLLIKNAHANSEQFGKIGTSLVQYLKQYPVELANQFDQLPPVDKTDIGATIGIRFMSNFTSDETVNKLFDELSSKCSSEKEKAKLNALRDKVFHP